MEEKAVMPYKEILITSIVGAIIGYITNWLAIKMLFFPRAEKRIFGMKVPFTPGLIPKEQRRIANSIGDAVGNHLLTSETMLEALEKNGVSQKFRGWVESRVLEVENSSKPLGEQIKHIIGEKFESLIHYIKVKVTSFVLSTIRKERFKEEIQALLLKEIKRELNNNPQIILDSEYYKNIRRNLLEKANEYKSSDDFKKSIQDIIENKISQFESENKPLKEIIPVELVSTLKVYVYSRNYDIAMTIKKMLKDESIQSKIKHALGDMISSNVNTMVAMFLNPDTIYSKLLPAIEAYLDKEETHREIAFLINELIDKGLENKLSNVLSNLSEEAKKRNAKSISDTIVDKLIDNKLIEELIIDLEEKLRKNNTLEEALRKLDIDVEEFIKRFITSKIDYAINSKGIEEKVELYVGNFIDDAMDMPLHHIFKGNENKISKAASEMAGEVFDNFMKTKAIGLIQSFDVSKIVEDKINGLDVSFTEDLILKITSKELEAITWLGALLGFVMGLVSSLMQKI